MTKERERFEVDTKGICILCFRNCSKEPFICSKTGTTITPFVGYLDVNLKKVCAFPGCEDQADEISNDLELVVTLCDKCEHVGNKFTSLLEQFEKIKSQMDDCCKKWHQLMDEGAKDVRMVQEYRSRMKTGNPLGVFHAAVAEKLRKETISRCSDKISSKKNIPNEDLSKRGPETRDFQALTPEQNPTLSQPSDDMDFDDEEQFLFPSPPQDLLSADPDPFDDVPIPVPEPDPINIVHFSTSTTVKPAFMNTTVANHKYRCVTCSKSFPSMTNLRSHGKIAHGSINAAVTKPKVTLTPTPKCLEKKTSKNNSRTQVPAKGATKPSEPNLPFSQPSDNLDFDDEVPFLLPMSSQDPHSTDADPLDDVSIFPSPEPGPFLDITSSSSTLADDKHTRVASSSSKTFPSMNNLRTHRKLTHGSITAVIAKPNVTLTPASPAVTVSQLLDANKLNHLNSPNQPATVHKLTDNEGLTDLKCKFCERHFNAKHQLLCHTILFHAFQFFSKYFGEGVHAEALNQIFYKIRDGGNVLPGIPNSYECPYCKLTTINYKNRYPFNDLKRHIVNDHTDILFQTLRDEFGAAANEFGDYQRFENPTESLESNGKNFEQKSKRRRSQVEQKDDPDIEVITIEDDTDIQMSEVEVQTRMTTEQNLTGEPSYNDVDFHDETQMLLPLSSQDSLSANPDPLGDVQTEPVAILEHHLVHQQQQH